MRGTLVAVVLIGFASSGPRAQVVAVQEPLTYTYREIDGAALDAFVFPPSARAAGARSNAILLFHGGGWSAGEPAWTFDAARRFAGLGLVAIAVQYRLSADEITPIEALDDACAALAWARAQHETLGLTGRVAGYGVSAGGHLIAAAATVGCPDGVEGPDALLLWSPAVNVAEDGWFRRMLKGRGRPEDYSPLEHVSPSTPPTSIVQGEKDTLTPLSGARRFCDRVLEAGGVCELNVYEGVGHLLTRNLANQESDFDPDPEARDDGIARHVQFLRTLGLIGR